MNLDDRRRTLDAGGSQLSSDTRRPPVAGGSDRLRIALRRLVRTIQAKPDFPCPDDPLPISEWGRDAEDRLCALEKKLANQNRLLLLSFVAIVADAVAKLLTRSGP